jgi:16S rRNA (uracil1498-N3)-methyltransferase
LSAERAEKKLAHWQGVIVAASEQSGRNRLARLAEPAELRQWITRPESAQRILLSPRADESLASWAQRERPAALSLLVGPEGGFSDEEEQSALRHGAIALAVGPRILRTETAALAAMAVLGAAWGGM